MSLAESSQDALAHDAGRRMTVLYATQTGNAEDVAQRLSREGRRRRFAVKVQSLDEYDKTSLISESLVIFIVSTHGQGDFPTSAVQFWRFLLRDGLPQDILSDVTFATFGLGDSSYKRYCWPIRKLNKRLKGLGAEELIEGGEADEQHLLGIDGALTPWSEKLWSTLDELVPLPEGVSELPTSQPLPPSINVRVVGNAPASVAVNGAPHVKGHGPAPPHGMRWATLTRNERLSTPDHFQDVRAIDWQVDAADQPIDYSAGDVAVIKPQNLPEDVDKFIQAAGWQEYADQLLELTPADPDRSLPVDVPSRITLRSLLALHLDPFSVPRPSFFHLIRHFAPPGHLEREKLDEYCAQGVEGADEMYEYAQRVRRTIAEVLDEFKSVRVPIEFLCEVIPWLRPREFSIASAPSTDTRKVELAVAIVRYKTRLHEPRRGVCTKWLAQLPVGTKLAFSIKPGTLRLPDNPATPIILVGPGTGIAPMRSLLHERLLKTPPASGAGHETNLVFCGCRHSEKDWIFAAEWREFHAHGKAFVSLAPSREKQGEKVYVQDKIKEEAQRVWEAIGRRQGWFYISGSSGKMPEAVRAAVEDVCAEQGGMSREDAEAYVKKMEDEGRWNEECWS